MSIETLLAARTLTRHLSTTVECVPFAHGWGTDACAQCGARNAADGLDELIAAQPTLSLSLHAGDLLAELWDGIDQEAVSPELRARVEAALTP